MALEFFLYRTDYNNTLIDRNESAFTLGANEGQIQINFLIPKGQALYLYRESGGTIIENQQSTINTYLNDFDPADSPNSAIEVSVFNPYTAATEIAIAEGSNGGVISGLTVSAVSTTEYSVSPGLAQIINVDFNTGKVSKIRTQFSGGTFTPSGLTSNTITYVGLDINGNIIEQNRRFQPDEKDVVNELGTVSHPNKSTISFAFSRPEVPFDPIGKLVDLQDFIRIGKFNLDDFLIRPSANTLSFRLTEGRIYRRSANFDVDPQNPDVTFFPERAPAEFNYINQFGVVESGITNTLITDEYEDSSGNSITITGSNNQATIQRLYVVESGRLFIQRGQEVYESISTAAGNFIEERKRFNPSPSLLDTGLLLGEFAIRASATNAANLRDVITVPSDKFGNPFGGSVDSFFFFRETEVISTLDAFPTPVNGDIFLQDNITYLINGTINLGSNRLVLGTNNLLQGRNVARDVIVANNPDAIFFTSGNSVNIRTLALRNFNTTGGTIFNCTGAVGENFILRNCIISNSRIGNVGKYNLIRATDVLSQDTVSGITLSNNADGKLAIAGFLFEDSDVAEETYIKIVNGNYSAVNINNCFFDMRSGTTGILVESGVTVNSGKISENEFVSTGTTVLGTQISGVTNATPRWTLNDNVGLAQGSVQATNFSFISTTNNGTATDIVTTGAFVKAEFTNDANSTAINFDNTVDNTVEYNGDTDDVVFLFLCTGSVSTDSNNQTVAVSIFKNGTENLVEQEVDAQSGGIGYNFAVNGVTNLDIGDTLDIRVANLGAVRDITIENVQFRIDQP